jgi:hypothetical protein
MTLFAPVEAVEVLFVHDIRLRKPHTQVAATAKGKGVV